MSLVSGLNCPYPILGPGESSQGDCRSFDSARSHGPHESVTVTFGHADIAENQVGLKRGNDGLRFGGRSRQGRNGLTLDEAAADEFPRIFLVIDDQSKIMGGNMLISTRKDPGSLP